MRARGPALYLDRSLGVASALVTISPACQVNTGVDTMLLDTTPLTSDGEYAVSFPRDTRDMSADVDTPPPERVTNFFIADILSPDFGRKRCAKCAIRPDGTSLDVPSEGDRTLWKVSQYRGKSELERGTLSGKKCAGGKEPEWPAWVYCTRYSDRPTAGPRSRKTLRKPKGPEEKRPRTAFTSEQICRLMSEFDSNRYLTEDRRRDLSTELHLSESQIKIWFQNKRAKLKKTTGNQNSLTTKLRGEGLYNHATEPVQATGVV